MVHLELSQNIVLIRKPCFPIVFSSVIIIVNAGLCAKQIIPQKVEFNENAL